MRLGDAAPIGNSVVRQNYSFSTRILPAWFALHVSHFRRMVFGSNRLRQRPYGEAACEYMDD
jgi:hypothetical protein